MTSAALLLVELVALFLGVSFAVHLLQRRLGLEKLRSIMGGPPVLAALKGIGIGFVTPFCTYSAVPVLVGLRQAGVPPAGYVAFIAAAPVLDPILFGALVLIVGLKVATIYMVVSFCAALTLALVAQRARLDRYLKPLDMVAGERDGSGCESPNEPWRGLRTESSVAFGAATSLLRSFGWLLVVGVGLGLLIERFVPAETAAEITSGNAAASIPIASALGAPLYINTELLVPIAHSLHGAGVGVGAIVALTIAGAGANLPEFVVLSRMARPGPIGVFFAYVFGVAMIGGAIAHTIA